MDDGATSTEAGRDEDRGLARAGAAAAGALLLAFAAPVLVGRVYVQDDLGIYTVLARAFQRGAILAGESPLWWPSLDGGLYLHGLGQLGLYHPLRWLQVAAIPLPWSFGLEVVMGQPLLGWGVLWLLRRHDVSRPAAVAGGLFAAFSPWALLHHVHTNVVAVAAHIPWLLGCLDVLLRDARPRRRAWATIAIALLTASQLLLHFPQVVVMSLQLQAFYLLVVGWSERTLGRALAPFALASLLGLGIGAVQVWPSFDYLDETARVESSIEFRSTYSLAPASALQLVAPWLYRDRHLSLPGEPGNPHELSAYAGAVPLLLALLLASAWPARGHRRGVAIALLVVAAIGFDLSLGRFGLLYTIQVRMPLIGLFRAPARNQLVFQLALAGLAALGLEALREARRRGAVWPWRRLWPVGLGIGLALAVPIGLGLAARGPGAETSPVLAQLAGAPALAAGAAVFVLAGVLIALSARGARFAPHALLVVAAADLGVFGLSYAWREPPRPWSAYRTAPPGIPPPVEGTRVHGGLTSFPDKTPNLFALWGHRVINGYVGATRRHWLDYRRAKPLRVAGVAWVWRNDLDPPVAEPVDEPLPRARLLTRARVSAAPAAALAQVEPARVAVVSDPVALDPGPPGTAEIVEDAPGRVRVRTRAPGRRLLVLSEMHLEGWRAEVDGAPARLVRAYGDFMGTVVGPGENEVRFVFDPPLLRRAEALAAGSALAVLLGGAGLLWRTR